jgi:UDP-2,3-diacylglucosamine hydrolase
MPTPSTTSVNNIPSPGFQARAAPRTPLNSESMTAALETLGIIAGSRSLPLMLARQARRMGVRRLVAIAFEGETNPDLAPLVDQILWLKVGQLSKLIRNLKDNGVTQCVMAGQITPKSLFDVRPDLRALGLLLKIKEKNAHTLFGALATELGRDGIQLIDALPWLQPLMPGPGFHLGPKLTPDQLADVSFGHKIAKEIARLDIGQTVVVKNGVVLAIEGFEGTDPCIARGGDLAGRDGGAVAIKVAKKDHDMRFDIPCIGPQTIETCAAHRIAALALEPGKTLLLEEEQVKEVATKRRIAVTTIQIDTESAQADSP